MRGRAVAQHREPVGEHGVLDHGHVLGTARSYTRRGIDRLARAMARVNVELKARDADPDATAARCVALGAEDRACSSSETRTSLRDAAGSSCANSATVHELIAYRRPDALGAGAEHLRAGPGHRPGRR